MIKKDNVLRFANLVRFDNLTHGFSTRFFGDMRPSHPQYKESLQKFSEALDINLKELVRMNQVHGNSVYSATEKDCGQTVSKTDGLLTEDENVFLSVITADCIPLFFYDPKKKFVAAVHAGWRGLFAEIIKEAVSQLVAQGSVASDILVGIGPSIRVCCYEVSEEFVENFREKFDHTENFVNRRDGKIFFDLQKVATSQLLNLHIKAENIEDADYCTFDHEDIYSCRREGKDFGEMMGIIGLRK